jgi:hypothetical protein
LLGTAPVTVNVTEVSIPNPPQNTNVNVECVSAAVTPTPPAVIDNCGRTVAPRLLSGPVYTPQNIICTGTVVWTYRYMACDNVTYVDWVYTVNVNDRTAPVITSIPANVTVSCATEVPSFNDAAVIASDNCGGPVTITHSDVTTAGSCVNRYTIARTYTATDVCGNSSSQTQTITVDDQAAPVITGCPGDQTFCETTDNIFSIPATISATDNCNGVVNITYQVSGATNRIGSGNNASGVFNTGISTIIWSAADICGNISTCTTIVTINALPQTSPIYHR